MIFLAIILSASVYCHGLLLQGLLSQGSSSNDTRIVSGAEETENSYVPYVALLKLEDADGNKYQCGASILDPHNLLTACHCLQGMKSCIVRIGSIDDNSGGKEYTASFIDMTCHTEFNPETVSNDIAVVKLKERMDLEGAKAYSITLPEKNEDIDDNKKVKASGWGKSSENGQIAHRLHSTIIPVVKQSTCEERYKGTPYPITNQQFCAGGIVAGEHYKDTCQGDSGGPAVEENTNKLLGIVSFGIGCGDSSHPGVYTKISGYICWIHLTRLCPVAIPLPLACSLVDGKKSSILDKVFV